MEFRKAVRFLAVGLGIVWGGTLWAGPSELNFQGVLLDASGNGVTGTRAMTVKLYDAAIGGNLLYTEDLGNVSVNKGGYSFNFGTNGTGNPKVTEIVAIASGTNSTFQKVFANTNVVTGSVSVTDGTYSWDQVNGSSDGGVNFDASYSSSLRRITVNYYNTAPSAGKTIRATYRSPSAGLAGILTNENDPWLEVSVAGTAQSPRQKLTATPFSLRAARVDEESYLETKEIDLPVKRAQWNSSFGITRGSGGNFDRFPIGVPSSTSSNYNAYSWESKTIIVDLANYIKEIISLSVNYTVYSLSVPGYPAPFVGKIDLSLVDSSDQQIIPFTFPRVATPGSTAIININRVIPSGEAYRLLISVTPGNDSGGSAWGGGNVNSITAKVKVPKTMALP